jgi:hypothetical protein
VLGVHSTISSLVRVIDQMLDSLGEAEARCASLDRSRSWHRTDDARRWQLHAKEVRLLASHLIDPDAKATTLKIADEYDRLATPALVRLQEQRAAAK